MEEHMMTYEDLDAVLDWKRDDLFLEFADVVQIGADAIREKRRLQERLERAEQEAKEWRDIAMGNTNTAMGIIADFVMLGSVGAVKITEDPARIAEELANMLEKRHHERG